MSDRLQEIANAYREMADEAKYRPEAPSDGVGNITVPLDQLDLDDEVDRYVRRFEEEDKARTFKIGCANFRTIAPMVYTIEAARLLCAGSADDTAAKLLKMAQASLEK